MPVAMTVAPMMMRMLKMADPTMVPTPISDPACGEMRDTVDEASSGADEPAAMNVAPATSSLSSSTSQMISSAGTKKSSHTMAMPRNMKNTPTKYAMSPPAKDFSAVAWYDSGSQLPPPARSLRPWLPCEPRSVRDASMAYSPEMGSASSVRPELAPWLPLKIPRSWRLFRVYGPRSP